MVYIPTLHKLSVCLVFSFVFQGQAIIRLLNDVKRDAPLETRRYLKFGCDSVFLNDQYETAKTLKPIWQDEPKGRMVIYSLENEPMAENKPEKVGPKERAPNPSRNELHTDEWNRFKDALRQSFAKTLETHTLNDVYPFIRFIQSYNIETLKPKKIGEYLSQNMSNFFHEYTVPFRPKENPAGLIIDLFHELDRTNPTSVKLEPYLVTSYVDPPPQPPNQRKLVIRNRKPTLVIDYLQWLTQARFPNHVAGAIPIAYNTRWGYILVEPGYKNTILLSPFAVVLMEDEKFPHGEFIFGNKLAITFTKYRSENDDSIMAHEIRRSFRAKIITPNGDKEVVYLLDKAYCSFLESTTKGRLLQKRHGIATFDPTGIPAGYLSFDVEKYTGFSLGNYEKGQHDEIPLLNITHLDRLNKGTLEVYSGLLKTTPARIISKIQTLISEFFEDSQFIDYYELKGELTSLYDRYNHAKSAPDVVFLVGNKG